MSNTNKSFCMIIGSVDNKAQMSVLEVKSGICASPHGTSELVLILELLQPQVASNTQLHQADTTAAAANTDIWGPARRINGLIPHRQEEQRWDESSQVPGPGAR